jgi:hypothetical protein
MKQLGELETPDVNESDSAFFNDPSPPIAMK